MSVVWYTMTVAFVFSHYISIALISNIIHSSLMGIVPCPNMSTYIRLVSISTQRVISKLHNSRTYANLFCQGANNSKDRITASPLSCFWIRECAFATTTMSINHWDQPWSTTWWTVVGWGGGHITHNKTILFTLFQVEIPIWFNQLVKHVEDKDEDACRICHPTQAQFEEMKDWNSRLVHKTFCLSIIIYNALDASL